MGIGYFGYEIKAVGAQELLCELNLVPKNNSLISFKISIKIKRLDKLEHPKVEEAGAFTKRPYTLHNIIQKYF